LLPHRFVPCPGWLICSVLISSLLQFLVGFSTSALNPIQPYCFPSTPQPIWALTVSIYAFGGPFGTVLSRIKGGIKNKILLCFCLFLSSSILQSLAPNIYFLALGRLIAGVASGFSTAITPIYLGEISPPSLRGAIGTVTQFACVVGILFSSVAAYGLREGKEWRVLLGFGAVISGFGAFGVKGWIVESPRYLLGRNPNSELGRSVLKSLRGFRGDDEVEKEVGHILGKRTRGEAKAGGEVTAKALNRLYNRTKPTTLPMLVSLASSSSQLPTPPLT